MSFRIVNRTYQAPDRNPEVFGFIEGYTSNTVGETFLRMNIKTETDEETLAWYRRVFGIVPYDVKDVSSDTFRSYLRERRAGDVVGEGIRLDRRQVCQLIWELIKWLAKGH